MLTNASALCRWFPVFLCSALAALAQAQRPAAPSEFFPKVNADRTVTFMFKAPNAKNVEVVTQFTQGPQALTPGAEGVWSVT